MLRTNNFLVFLALLTVAMAASSCRLRSSDRFGGSHFSAVVEGLEPGDEQRLKGIVYLLQCKSGYKEAGQKSGEKDVEFSDKGLSYGDECWLEIRADKNPPEGLIYRWLSKPKEEGLYYSSNYSKVSLLAVDSGKKVFSLNFKVFKVYGIEYADSFPATLVVDFKLGEGDILPNDEDLLGNIECGKGEKYPSSTVLTPIGGGTTKEFVFLLSAALMKSVTCTKISIAKKNIPYYVGTLKGVEFLNPRKDEAVRFKGPFEVSSTEEVIGLAKCSTPTSEASEKLCKVVILPRTDKNIWFAVVAAKDTTTSQKQQMIVTNMDQFNPDFNSTLLDASVFQQEASASSGLYAWYKIEARDTILGTDFNPNAVRSAINAYKIDPQALAEDMATNKTILGIKEVYTHGFKTIAENILNQRSKAHWLAKVSAIKGNETQQFIISGGGDYFYSASKPATGKFFDWDTYKANSVPGNGKYRMYAFAGAGVSKAGCDTNFAYFVDGMSEKTLAEVTGTPADSKIAGCRIDAEKDLKAFNDGWLIKASLLVWDWQKFVP